jgi:hypothetical protein
VAVRSCENNQQQPTEQSGSKLFPSILAQRVGSDWLPDPTVSGRHWNKQRKQTKKQIVSFDTRPAEQTGRCYRCRTFLSSENECGLSGNGYAKRPVQSATDNETDWKQIVTFKARPAEQTGRTKCMWQIWVYKIPNATAAADHHRNGPEVTCLVGFSANWQQ